MTEQRNIRTQGIILKKHPFGENDFSVTLYSPDLGKIQATAKGGRKITSSFSGHIETLNFCEFQLYKSPVRYTMIQCHVLENFKNIRKNFDRVMMASLIIEIFHKSTLSTEHSAELFDLLEQSLSKLNSSEQYFLTIESFKLNLLNSIGVLPNLENCSSCHERWNNGHTIWLEKSGHLHCQDCFFAHTMMTTIENQPSPQPGLDAKQIEFNIIKLINYLIQPPNQQTKTVSFNQQQKEQLQHITGFFLQHFLEREILSERLITEMQ